MLKNLQHLIFAVFERRLVQHWIDCMQFFFYIIFAVLVKYHGVNNRHYHFIKGLCQPRVWSWCEHP